MGTPNTVNQCANCGEPVIQYNNTGAWKHYPAHPLTTADTNCMMPNVLIANVTTSGGLATNKKTAVNKS